MALPVASMVKDSPQDLGLLYILIAKVLKASEVQSEAKIKLPQLQVETQCQTESVVSVC